MPLTASVTALEIDFPVGISPSISVVYLLTATQYARFFRLAQQLRAIHRPGASGAT